MSAFVCFLATLAPAERIRGFVAGWRQPCDPIPVRPLRRDDHDDTPTEAQVEHLEWLHQNTDTQSTARARAWCAVTRHCKGDSTVQLLNQKASICIAATLAAPPAIRVLISTCINKAGHPATQSSLIAMPKRQRKAAAVVLGNDDQPSAEQPHMQGAADVDSDTQSDSAVTDGSEETDSADDDDGSSMDDEAGSLQATGAVTSMQLMGLHRCHLFVTLLAEPSVYVHTG